MGSDPGTDIPRDQGLRKEILDQNNIEDEKSSGERCNICGLVARNNIELDDHIKHAHRQGDSNNSNDVYSKEQKIDPFVKTED
ncbi:hypothetical protein [Candidatus Nitrosocosmicus arcticus]|uniref:Uncharacterized protein n=1 Tax=Candidatus Nitrosocosmicus arcticus TaxID=2035267 RepID=A0A557SY89_9ARCH|nr:hypothetical protein [Candidatus Nitrosocosmicus arcticus]TVP41577.1 hypothetical protein NARC_30292 [Candidatus Nitrosocosmicus arcticus]